MSSAQTLISALTWIPRGRASAMPRRYELDDAEMERVGRMGGEGVLDKLREEMSKMEVDDEKRGADGKAEENGMGDDDWESESSDAEGSGSSHHGDNDGDVAMDSKPAKASDPNDLSAYNLDDYDNEVSRGAAMGAFSNIKGLTFYRDNNDDPYITLKNENADPEADDDERDALEIQPTDSLILTAKTSEDLSSLEYHVYDESAENLWVHHDLMLPSMPLCVEWLDFPASGSGELPDGQTRTHGNFVAVGTFDTAVEIWDLDVLDGLYPTAILGPSPNLIPAPAAETPKPARTGKKKKRAPALPPMPTVNPHHHAQSVISLSWTPAHRNLLLSSSADESIKLWDLTKPSPVDAIKSWDNMHPGEKVLAVEWNKYGVPGCGGPPGAAAAQAPHSTVVLSAGERTVKVWDSRVVGGALSTGRLGADVECVRWDPWNPMDFFVSLENGLVLCYDARTLTPDTAPGTTKSKSLPTPPQPKYTISAHDGACCALDVNPHIKGCLITGGMDKVVKVWNINESEDGRREISLVTSRDLGVGRVFSAKWSPDSPLTLAAGGSQAKLQLWDVSTNAGARQAFGPRLRQHGRDLAEAKKGSGVIGLDDDEEDSDEDEVA